MDTSAKVLDIFILIFSLISVTVQAGEYCITGQNSGFFTTYEYSYCSYGCCGDIPDQYCCGVYTWIIIVAVIGAIIFISCIAAVICCVVKSNGHRGRVVQPTGAGVTMITATNPGPSYGYPPPGQAGYQPPPGYNQPQPGFQPQPGYQPPPGYQPMAGFQQPPGVQFGSQYPPPPAGSQSNQASENPAFPPPKSDTGGHM